MRPSAAPQLRDRESMTSDLTVGVEEEYQLVDPVTRELRSRAGDVLRADWSREMTPEFHQTMVEVGTPVCASAAALGRELRRLRTQAASTAAAEELEIVAAGVHPFSRWEGHRMTASERYARLFERFGRVVRTEHVFGMHVHVAIPAGMDRLHLINAVREWLPHLTGLAASSPFYEGEDTRYASYRSILASRLPHSGVPPRLESEREYARLMEMLSAAGALEDAGSLYWSIRPHPRYPTLEFRTTDVCPRVEDAAALAALIRACVAAAAEGRLASEPGGLGHSAHDALLATNDWQAARYGLAAEFASPTLPSGRETLRDGVRRLLERVGPTAEALGDGAVLAGVDDVLARGNGADRIRAAAAACGSLPAVVDWLAAETLLGTGMDRRRDQRQACA
jgi:glutamate---cysteine ligase / carboxylate-amine ligase